MIITAEPSKTFIDFTYVVGDLLVAIAGVDNRVLFSRTFKRCEWVAEWPAGREPPEDKLPYIPDDQRTVSAKKKK